MGEPLSYTAMVPEYLPFLPDVLWLSLAWPFFELTDLQHRMRHVLQYVTLHRPQSNLDHAACHWDPTGKALSCDCSAHTA